MATYSANIKVNVTGLPSLQRLEDRVALLHKNFTKINAAAANITAPFQNHIRALEQMNRLLVANGRLLDQQANAANRLARNTGGGGGQNNGGNPRVLEEQRRGWQQQIILLQQRARLLTDNAQITDKLRSATNNLIAGSQATVRLGLEQLKNAKALLTAAEDLAKTEALNFEHQLELISEVEKEEEQNARNTARRIKQEQDDRNALLRQRMTALQRLEQDEERAESQKWSRIRRGAGMAGKVGGSLLDAVTFGNGAAVAKGTANSAIRGGLAAATVGAGAMQVGADSVLRSLPGGDILANIGGSLGKGVSAMTGPLGVVGEALHNMLSTLGHLPQALQLAAIAAFAFAPAVGGIGAQIVKGLPAIGDLGKALLNLTGISERAQPILSSLKKTLNTAVSDNALTTGLYGLGKNEMKLPPNAGAFYERSGSTAFGNNLQAALLPKIYDGLLKGIQAEYDARMQVVSAEKSWVAFLKEGAEIQKEITKQANIEAAANQIGGKRFAIRSTNTRTQFNSGTAEQNAASVADMRAKSDAIKALIGNPFAYTKEAVPGGNTMTAQSQYRGMLNDVAKQKEANAAVAEFAARTDEAAKAAARLASEWYKLRRIQKLNSSKSPEGGFPVAGPMESPGFKKTKKGVGSFGENLALGAGFPLLFGAGPGSIAGSIAGSFMGSGFGGQILGGALGAVLDTAVVAVQKLGNAFVLVGDSYASIREQGVYFTAELEKQVNLAKAQGNLAKAQELQASAMTVQTGDVGGLANTGATAAVNELQKAWSGVTKAVGTTLAILATPFLFALDAILRGVQAIFMVVNLAVTGIGNLINLIPGAKQLGAQLAEMAQRGTVEYENQLAELDKQITSNSKNLELLRAKDGLLARSLTMSKVSQQIDDKKIATLERINAFEEELRKLRENAPIGTAELRNKLAEQEYQLKEKFALEEKAIALKDARDIFNSIVENNRNIKNQQRANELEYRDMVLQGLRAQQDFNLEVLRRVQDAKMRMREQELQYEQKLTAEQIKRQQLDNRQQTLQGSVDSVLSSNPDRASIINSVRTAISEWRTGRMSVEAEAAQKQQEIQLNFQKAQVAIERYKYDNAIKIARANEDSQNRIAKINEGINKQNDEVSRMQYRRMLESFKVGYDEQVAMQKRSIEKNNFYLKLAAQGVPGSEGINTTGLRIENKLSRDMIAQLTEDKNRILGQFSGLEVSKLTPMAKVPGMSNTSAPASAAEAAANLQLKQNEQAIAQLQKINGLKENDLKLAEQLLKPNSELLNQYNDIIKQQKDKAAFEREYGGLIRNGTLPEIAKELADLKVAKDLTEAAYDYIIDTLRALPEFTTNPKIQELVTTFGNLKSTLNTKATEASGAIIEGSSPRNRLQNKANEVAGQLNTLQDPVNQIINMAGLLGQSFDDTFSAITKGTITAKEAFAQLTQSMAANFMKMATDMITKWIEMQIIGLAMNFFPGLGGSKGLSNLAAPASFNNPLGDLSGIGLPYMAAGGPVSGNTPYIVGEKGPELFVPSSGGKIVPNDSLGGGGGVQVGAINISVQNSGENLSPAAQKQIAGQVQSIVMATLVDQRRSGGVLAR